VNDVYKEQKVRVGRLRGSGSQQMSSPRIHHSPKAVDSSCSGDIMFAEADEHTLARSGGHGEVSSRWGYRRGSWGEVVYRRDGGI
jgi:hypothetical protein